MDLSIIILNYQSKGLVKQCLKGIKNSNLSLSYEIIVVDNASNDGCLEMVKNNFLGVKTIQADKNHGYAAGNNLGIKATQGKYIMILNPDVAVLENSIQLMFEFMENRVEVGLAGPRLINPDKSVQFSCMKFPTLLTPLYRRTFLGRFQFVQKKLKEYQMSDCDHAENREVDWIFGACMIVRKSAIEKVGLLDEKFFLYFEDTDWCRRFWRAGFKVYYVANAKMVHYHGRLSDSGILGIFKKATRTHIKSWLRYFWKNK